MELPDLSPALGCSPLSALRWALHVGYGAVLIKWDCRRVFIITHFFKICGSTAPIFQLDCLGVSWWHPDAYYCDVLNTDNSVIVSKS